MLPKRKTDYRHDQGRAPKPFPSTTRGGIPFPRLSESPPPPLTPYRLDGNGIVIIRSRFFRNHAALGCASTIPRRTTRLAFSASSFRADSEEALIRISEHGGSLAFSSRRTSTPCVWSQPDGLRSLTLPYRIQPPRRRLPHQGARRLCEKARPGCARSPSSPWRPAPAARCWPSPRPWAR